MSDLISFKTNWKNGVVLKEHLNYVWEKFSKNNQMQILSMLEDFEVVTIYPSSCEEYSELEKIIIPSMVKKKKRYPICLKNLFEIKN